ncbi:phosphoribosyltransferase family protein, partial [Neobacillus citreus]
MEYINCSIGNIRNICYDLSRQVKDSGFEPDIIIYVANGGIIIGQEMSNLLSKPYYGIKVARSGNSLKKNLSFLIRILPGKVKDILRTFELNSGLHSKASTREIKEVNTDLPISVKKILVVDDSVDTGNTILSISNWLY